MAYFRWKSILLSVSLRRLTSGYITTYELFRYYSRRYRHDADLRYLIGNLVESDYRGAGLYIKGITWGGKQDAVDGGLDVSVRSKENPPQLAFLLVKQRVYKLKFLKCLPEKLERNAAPKIGRQDICNLIKDGGSYIIVSQGILQHLQR